MASYFEYLQKMFLAFMRDLGDFFYKVFVSPWTDLPENFNTYNSYLGQHYQSFGFWGWFFWVLFLLLFIALLGGIGFLVVVFFRKYIRSL